MTLLDVHNYINLNIYIGKVIALTLFNLYVVFDTFDNDIPIFRRLTDGKLKLNAKMTKFLIIGTPMRRDQLDGFLNAYF